MCGKSSAAIPIPLSVTVKIALPFSRNVRTLISPLGLL